MDVFSLRNTLIHAYEQYVTGFVRVKEPRAQAFVDDYFRSGRLWPEPLVQLNPAFEPGPSIEELVRDGVLHADCARIFRSRQSKGDLGHIILLHRHQCEAVAAAQTGESYVLTTGTGSGKSLAYFIPIVDYVLTTPKRPGVKAIVVYPMNALCNSQLEALEHFIDWGYPGGGAPVTYKRYTGQESSAERQAIVADPPDILLTNFVMLELILTRSDEATLIEQCQGLEFLVLDELHTYRGRQGADVAMLVRRVRERCGAPTMRCVGTSATLAGAGTREERRTEVASVASLLFGCSVPPTNVIGETLQPATSGAEPAPAELAALLGAAPLYPKAYAELVAHPLAIWAETAFGLQQDEQDRLERREPRTLSDAAAELAAWTNVSQARCAEHLQALLMAGYAAQHPDTHAPLFAFRLHQFISRGDTLYVTPEPPAVRQLTADGQQFVPGDRSRLLFPTALCRVCGQDYMVVSLASGKRIVPRDLEDRPESDEQEAGFLVLEEGADLLDLDSIDNLPEDWTEPWHGGVRVRSQARAHVPRRLQVLPDGSVEAGYRASRGNAWFIPAPFRFCAGCGVTYAAVREKEFTRLAQLSSEGRSTATTVLSLALVRALREDASLEPLARKLLSFTDNRQDASLQAGHFNDFIQVTLLRSAILAAVRAAGPAGLAHDDVAVRVRDAMALEFGEYASNPDALFNVRRATDDALREVAGYRVYHDLRRGWRIVSPNLEAVGLLRIEYDDLAELCREPSIWRELHPVLAAATPQERETACRAVLDTMRRGLAIKVRYLDRARQDSIRQNSSQYLTPPWAIDDSEALREGGALVLQRDPSRRGIDDVVLNSRSLAGRFLARHTTWASVLEVKLSGAEVEALAADLLTALAKGGHVEEVAGSTGVYQLQAGTMRWKVGDGQVQHDPIRVPRPSAAETHVHQFFAALYHVAAQALHGIEAREHTAQVPTQERQRREAAFGRGELPVLYCSPTMELGVDIRDLNAVNMRNVPPTPANYAQRSGRAGRQGQPALVVTYCTTYSPHDQYYFRRPTLMVAGVVSPPRLDLANEELVRAHVHAVWLAETGQSLGASVADLLELGDAALPLKPEVRDYLERPPYQSRAEERCRRILAMLANELTALGAPWYSPEWLQQTIRAAPASLNEAAGRWRELYRSATQQRDRQHAIAGDHLRRPDERDAAKRLRGEAEAQLALLTRTHQDLSADFYSYRYFATAGFLPGYNFPRLPVSAYIPGRSFRGGDEEYLTRPRFIALAEFGPRAVVYHEGSRYRVSRVMFRRGDKDDNGTNDGTVDALCCKVCGYAHFGEAKDANRCHHCNVLLTAASSQRFYSLLRLENVSTQRVDRITSDEEERQRQGYDVQTMYRFNERDGRAAVVEAQLTTPEATVASLVYGPATTIWRVNLGWRRRKQKDTFGFLLDMEKGIWSRSDEETDSTDADDPLTTARVTKRVLPYVDDHRNALLLELAESLSPAAFLSVQYALKRGIEIHYQLEESELAVEPLPSADAPQYMLFYEASEGGAGVLVRLATEPEALAQVAREALCLCHFDPEKGTDLGQAERARERCEAACYDCILSYSNQRYHRSLDRHIALTPLTALARTRTAVGAGGHSRAEQRARLLRLCESALERDFLNWLDEHGYRLPDQAQATVDGVAARPDFAYDDAWTVVYVDGYPHRFPERQERDEDQQVALENAGWTVLRVQGPESWPPAVQERSWLFGAGTPDER